MIQIGANNTLRIDRESPQGFYLMDKEEQSVLLPSKYILPDMKLDDEVEVFVYKDNEGRPIATTLSPLIQVNQFASLEVKATGKMGSFLEMGVEKDLLLPFREQRNQLSEGDFTVVYVYLDDKTDRLVATERINKHLKQHQGELQVGDQVEALIYEETNLGFKAVVNQQFSGLVYANELYEDLFLGDEMQLYVKRIRDDHKLDLQVQAIGYQKIDGVAARLLDRLQKNNGYLPLHDKSNPELIKSELNVSKKAFKKAIGLLYKNKIILLESEGIRLK